MTENLNGNINENANENVDEVRPFSWWKRLVYVFTSPNKVFENLAIHPRVLFPMLVLIIGMAILGFTTITKEAITEQILQQPNMQGNVQLSESAVNIGYYSGLVMVIVLPLLAWLFKSLIVYGIAALSGGEGSFKKSFSVIGHAYFPVILGSLIFGILTNVIGKGTIGVNLSVLLPDSMSGSFLYSFFAQLDIFVIWYQVLAIIGISHAFKISKGKSSAAVLIPWGISMIVVSALAVIGSNFAKGMM